MKKVLKWLGIGFVVFIVLGMFAGEEETESVSNDTTNVTVVEEQEEMAPQQETIVLVDNEYCTISITEKYEDAMWNEVGFKLLIENKTDVPLLIGIENVSVDGFMNDPFWADSVTPGNKAVSSMSWIVGADSNPNVKSTEDLKNINMTFNISNDETWDRLADVNVTID